MADRGMLANVTETRIRASVSFVAPAATATAQQISAAAAVIKGRTSVSEQLVAVQAQYVVPAAYLSYVTIVLDVVIDPVGRNPFVRDIFVATDTAIISVGKLFSEAQRTAETKTIVFGKGINDAPQSADAKAIGFGRPVSDASSAFEQTAKAFIKSPVLDLLNNSDASTINVGKGLLEATHQSEGPFFGQTYVDVSYLAQDYVLDGYPIFLIGKVISDTRHATDDFINHAIGDDDEVMLFGKSLIDPIVSSELIAKGLTRAPIADVAGVSDSTAIGFSRSFSDALAKSDASFRAIGKAATDSVALQESGHLFYVNYADGSYFAQEYVGTTVNF